MSAREPEPPRSPPSPPTIPSALPPDGAAPSTRAKQAICDKRTNGSGGERTETALASRAKNPKRSQASSGREGDGGPRTGSKSFPRKSSAAEGGEASTRGF